MWNDGSGQEPAAGTVDVQQADPIPAEARAEIERLLTSGDLFRYTTPDKAPVPRLEAEFAALMGTRYALAVSSCSAALFLSLKALDLPRGATVLIPGFTFAAVPSSVLHAELVPVLVEVDDSLRIDMDDFRSKLPGAGAVMISHMRGHTSDMDAITAACNAAGVPVIEDAAHSLGASWGGRKLGTIGKTGCFSFQSYKLVNAGEGGMLITDDPVIAGRAAIMSGAYEANWKTHPGMAEVAGVWQNKLPLYNLRMQNLSAAVIRPQLPLVELRARRGLVNHDRVAAHLAPLPWFHVPPALPRETRAPDSFQFLLRGDWTDDTARAFQAEARANGAPVSIFGLSEGNARAYWNWHFLGDIPDLPKTRAMLMRACDIRLPARLTPEHCDALAGAILAAAAKVRQSADAGHRGAA
ncbi:MAG: DegT/DnrJ/EryC1/StrS family aminotransferase [Gemmobacter sp.]